MGHGGWRNWQKNYILELNENKKKPGIFLTSLYEVIMGVKWDRNATNRLTHHGGQVLREEQDKIFATENHSTHKRHCVIGAGGGGRWAGGWGEELDDGLEMLLQNLSKEMRTWIGQKENGYSISSQAWRWGWKHEERHASKKITTTGTMTTWDLTSTKDTNGKKRRK